MRKRQSIFKIKESEPKVLRQRIIDTLERFPLLKHIYDEEFIQFLIRKRFHLENRLLWFLASKEPTAIAMLEKLEERLKTLADVDGVEKFRSKLRQYDRVSLSSAFLEIDFASHYKKKYPIEIEPSIPGTKKGPDLKVESEYGPIFFEIKNILTEEDKKLRKFERLVMDKIGIIKERYVFSVHIRGSPDLNLVELLRKYVRRKFRELSKRGVDKAKLKFPEDNPIVEIDIHGRPNKLDHGYLASFSWFGGRSYSRNIRKKIKSKVRQLPKGEMNVVVIEYLGELIDFRDDFITAVMGDEVISLNMATGEMTPKRGSDRIFRPDCYTRISAVCGYKKTFENGKWSNHKFILHNPFAEKKIPAEFFDEPNIRQFIPDENKSTDEYIEFKIIGKDI